MLRTYCAKQNFCGLIMNKNNVYHPIAIPLKGFHHIHATHDGNKKLDHLFVGRDEIIKKLVSILNDENRTRGSYLIAGYRGVGKTSVINKALNKHISSGNEKTLDVRINLGDNSQLDSLNIYFSMANILREVLLSREEDLLARELAKGNSWKKLVKELVKGGSFKNLKGKWLELKLWLKLNNKKLFSPTVSLTNVAKLFFFFSSLMLIFIMFIVETTPKQAPIEMYYSFLQHFKTINEWWLFYLSSFIFLLLGFVWSFSSKAFPEFYSIRAINNLIEQMSNETNESQKAGINSIFNFGLSRDKRKPPLNAREAEDQFLRILKQLKRNRFKVVFVLDEIDKLSDYEELSETDYNDLTDAGKIRRVSQINTLLGTLKNFVTTADATFFFISGRETLDRYYSEKGSPNSLYESLFDKVYEVTSFLTDEGVHPKATQLSSLIEEYVCRRIRSKNDEGEKDGSYYYTLNEYYKSLLSSKEQAKARLYINTLRNFIYFLTFHSWGNPKRLTTIFESFIVPKKITEKKLEGRDNRITGYGKDCVAENWLIFSISDMRSLSLTSEITTIFQHQLSREVTKISDKLVVSVFSSIHFILKLHSYGFTRETLHRMSETINIYRSPELNTIVDDLLTHVFKPYIRRIRNGMYRFRFHSGFEQELRYISHVSELESASYNFSLNSMKHVKRFFKETLANNNSNEIGVISRLQIVLGDMSAIEQSYNAASVHYSIANRLLCNGLHEKGPDANLQTLLNYIEVLLKQGDLAERRHDYNSAAALYSEAESVVENNIDGFKLSGHLRKGDSKWDVLKQPFWASKYLSLKRSPPPYKGDLDKERDIPIPDYLYRTKDPRFYNYAAGLHFFLGDVKSAARCYSTTLEVTSNNSNLMFPSEKNSYLKNHAKVGVVESTLLYHSRKLFEDYQSSLKEGNGKFKDILGALLNLTDEQNILRFDKEPDQKIGYVMRNVVDDYENNRLYTSAVITCIKTICYFTTILDSFDSNTFNNDPVKKATLNRLVVEISSQILSMGEKAARCIDKARQLESSQSIKTLMINDLHSNEVTQEKDFTTLIYSLLRHNSAQETSEEIFWQQSLWTHKLASSLLWAKYVKDKIQGNTTAFKEEWLPDLNIVSVRSAILIRWVHARYLLHCFFDKKLANNEILTELAKPGSFDPKKINIHPSGFAFIGYMRKREDVEFPEIVKQAYAISRTLYFALNSSRIISRKNIDLIFPRPSQIYHIQWKLLTNLMSVIILAHKKSKSRMMAKHLTSVRKLSFFLQERMVSVDEKMAPHERIPPSFFDYEYIYLRLEESLESSINLADRTSRSHMSIFQHKYFCHDDHNDQEFHMDYTIAYMFTPMDLFFKNHIINTDKNIREVIEKLETDR